MDNEKITNDETLNVDENVMNTKCKITTFDNPYDPFTNWDEWFMFDESKGYSTCSKLARIAKTTDDMSEAEIIKENERAIDELIKYDFMNIYKKVKRNA